MICPFCQKDTSLVLRHCQNCNADLEEYRTKRNQSIQGTGNIYIGKGFELETLLLKLGPIGGIILMLFSAVVFIAALLDGVIYFYLPILFLIGVYGLIEGIRRNKKRKQHREMKERGEILE